MKGCRCTFVQEARVRGSPRALAEADIAYSIRGALAEELQRTPGLTLKPNYPPGTFWLVFPEQWLDLKSPWADRRVRRAASYAIDRQAINQTETLGLSRITGSIIPHRFDFYWPAPVPTPALAKARQLLAAAGYPKGFDAGDYYCDASYANLGEAVINYLKPAGIRVQLRPLERAAFINRGPGKIAVQIPHHLVYSRLGLCTSDASTIFVAREQEGLGVMGMTARRSYPALPGGALVVAPAVRETVRPAQTAPLDRRRSADMRDSRISTG